MGSIEAGTTRAEYRQGAVPAIVSVQSVSKSYGPGIIALDDVSMEVRPGEIVALVGPNGAGKTTLLEIIEGIRKPDLGDVTVFGESASRLSRRVRRRIGAQLQGFRGFRHHSVSDLLEILVTAYGASTDLDDVLDRFDLKAERTRQFSQLSGGERQRVALAAAACGGAELLILDEPTSDMDPDFRRFVWEFLGVRSSLGVATLFSTHQIAEIDQYCDRVVVMKDGRLVADGTVEELTRAHGIADLTKVEVTWTGPQVPDPLRRFTQPSEATTGSGADRKAKFTVTGFDEIPALLDNLRSVPGMSIRLHQGTIEDVYFKLMGGHADAAQQGYSQ